jgi:hypothetical protein
MAAIAARRLRAQAPSTVARALAAIVLTARRVAMADIALDPAKALPALIKEPAKGKSLRPQACLADLTGTPAIRRGGGEPPRALSHLSGPRKAGVADEEQGARAPPGRPGTIEGAREAAVGRRLWPRGPARSLSVAAGSRQKGIEAAHWTSARVNPTSRNIRSSKVCKTATSR